MPFRRLLIILLLAVPAQAQITVPFPEGGIPAAPLPFNVYELKPVKSIAEAGIINPLTLYKADALVNQAIAARAFPGCRVLAAKDGKIFYDKAFGYQTYEPVTPVTMNTVYDLASLTKVVSTTLCIMRLYEQGKISLDRTLSDYLPMTVGTDKACLPLSALLLHQAGLKAWIPFYKSFYDTSRHLLDTAYRIKADVQYHTEVAKDLYLRKDYRDTIWHMILTSPLENTGKYVYSDLDYYFLAAIAEHVTGKPINRYVAEQFYTPMGLKMIGYLPLQFLRRESIAPTESDTAFRHQLLQGYVHDPGAALFGGVAGHAGIFATAGDVAAIFQMLLNGGSYRGKTYFRPETVAYFTAYHSAISRRGLGFDKPAADRNDAGPTATRCSGYTFGHQGFTGTCAWADPASGVVFVFLSNRVYPSADNGLINKMSTRTTVQNALYESLNIPEDTARATVKMAQVPPK